jgi:hypothetical protein
MAWRKVRKDMEELEGDGGVLDLDEFSDAYGLPAPAMARRRRRPSARCERRE